jgi:hypothetical protein
LKKNTADLPNVRTYPYALIGASAVAAHFGKSVQSIDEAVFKEKTLKVPFYRAHNPKKPDKPSQAGSLLKPTERLKLSPITYPDMIEVEGMTLDSWSKHYHIDHVDLLWLDMQGLSLNVLMASPEILTTVSVIHTEVEFVQAYENQYTYRDVKQWLELQGFAMVAKDFPDEPTWFFGNAVFKRNS